ncbi:hypothetical protein GCM10023403_10740 [Pseudonocardia benzenivorans]
MSKVTQEYRAPGDWSITFAGLPQEIVDQLDELGHVVVTKAHEDGPALGDTLVTEALYTGVVIYGTHEKDVDQFTLSGEGIEWWLGTPDKLGEVIETPKTYSGNTFSSVITDLIPGSLAVGTLTNTGLTTYTGTQQWQSPREAIDYVCDTLGATWRINPDFTLDAGPQSAVFASGRAVIVRRPDDAGEDMTLRAYPGPAEVATDVEDFTTRVVVLGEVSESTVVTGTWDIASGKNPYKDFFGNPVKLTRLVSESSTEGVNANARAEAIGEQYENPQRAITLDSIAYEFDGTIQVGDMVWIWDPDSGLTDDTNEVQFRGYRLNPISEQVTTLTWPVTSEMGVYYRSRLGAWIDLSPWVVGSDDATTIEVGKNTRELASSGASVGGNVPKPDTSIPNPPTFIGTPFPTATYEQGDTGITRAQVQVKWQLPATNTDGTDFVDGSHFEIGYRPSAVPAYPATYAQAAAAGTYSSLGTWGQPVTMTVTDWQTAFAPIDAASCLIAELAPGTPYDFRIRVLDSATPPNASAWSSTYTQYMPVDVTAPNTPAAPVVAGSKIAVSVKHYLGDDSGGTFNLSQDLAGLKVHIGTSATFTIDPRTIGDGGTFAGRIIATRSQIVSQVAVVQTFPVDTTNPLWVRVVAYDLAGNESPPSAAAAVTATLIDNQWISDLTADKITAGTFQGAYVVGGEFSTGGVSQRMRMYYNGLQALLSDGVTPFVDLDIANQTILVAGTIQSGLSGTYWQMNPDGTLRHYATGYAGYSQITSLNGDLIMRGRLDANSRSGRINTNSIGVGINFSSDAEVTSGNLRAEIAVFDRLASYISPLHRFYINEKLSSPDANPRRISFGKLNSSGVDVSSATVWYLCDASNNPMFVGTGANSGIKFEAGQISVVNGDGTVFGPIKATSFIPSSTEDSKTDIVDARALLNPRDAFRARAKAWKYKSDVEQYGDAAPTKFGPVTEDLPAELVYMTPKADGSGELEGSIDLVSMNGIMWARLNQLEDLEIRYVHGSVVLGQAGTLTWQKGSVHDIPITWDEAPLDKVRGADARLDVGVAWQGKVSARVLQDTVTDAGCTVRVTASALVVVTSALPLTVHAVAAYLYDPPYVPEAS